VLRAASSVEYSITKGMETLRPHGPSTTRAATEYLPVLAALGEVAIYRAFPTERGASIPKLER